LLRIGKNPLIHQLHRQAWGYTHQDAEAIPDGGTVKPRTSERRARQAKPALARVGFPIRATYNINTSMREGSATFNCVTTQLKPFNSLEFCVEYFDYSIKRTLPNKRFYHHSLNITPTPPYYTFAYQL